MKQGSKIRQKPFGMNEPSLPGIDSCPLPVTHLANALMKSEMKAKNYHTPTLTTSLILFVVTQKKAVRIPSPATCLQPFYMLYLQAGPYFLFCFYYLLLLQHLDSAVICSVLFLPSSLGKRGRER